MNWQLDERGVVPALREALAGRLATVAAAVVDHPEHPPGRSVRLSGHHLVDEPAERLDACFRLAAAKDLGLVHVPSSVSAAARTSAGAGSTPSAPRNNPEPMPAFAQVATALPEHRRPQSRAPGPSGRCRVPSPARPERWRVPLPGWPARLVHLALSTPRGLHGPGKNSKGRDAAGPQAPLHSLPAAPGRRHGPSLAGGNRHLPQPGEWSR